MLVEQVSIMLALIIFTSVYFLKISKKYNIPTLLIFIFVGILAGSEGIGNIYFSNAHLANFIGSLSLCIILFSGAFNTDIEDVRPIRREGILLAFMGVFFNTIFVAIPLYLISSFSIVHSLLIGAIVSSTDSSAVLSILSFGKLNIKKMVAGILKLESGVNDPMANVLILILIPLLSNPEFSFFTSLVFLLKQILLALITAYSFIKLTNLALDRLPVKTTEVYEGLILSFLLLTFGVTNIIGGNGFLAVYLLGIKLGNSLKYSRKKVREFFASTAWFVEVGLFVMLGLFVFPSRLADVWPLGLFISFILIFVARPLSVFASLHYCKIDFKEKLFISLGGLKGAVPIVFATFPIVMGVEGSDFIFHLIFFVIISSVLVQGLVLPIAAKKLEVFEEEESKFEEISDNEYEYIEDTIAKVHIIHNHIYTGKLIREIDLAKNLIIISILRDNKYLVPKGETKIIEGDYIYLMGEGLDEYL